MKKKILSVLLGFFLLMGIISVNASSIIYEEPINEEINVMTVDETNITPLMATNDIVTYADSDGTLEFVKTIQGNSYTAFIREDSSSMYWSRGNKQIGQVPKHLLSGLLRCPECGSGMVISYNRWVNKKKNPDAPKMETRSYICGHYNRSGTYGECHRNGISSRIEKEVVEYTKRLVHNEKFVNYVKMKIGKSIDVTEIENELVSYDKKLKALERNKKSLEKDIDSLLDDDKFANRKRTDMNKRLDKIYEDMDSLENERIDCLNRLEAVQEQQLNEKKIYQMLLEFDRIYDKLSLEEQRNVLHSLISEIQLYKKDEIKESKTYIKKIKFAFDIENIGENLDNKGNNVETVCLLRNLKSKPI